MQSETIYIVLLWSQFIFGPIVLFSLLFVTAPYGRHLKTGWGLILDTRTAWVLMELPAVLTLLLIYCFNYNRLSPEFVVFLVLWEIHYLYRTFYFPFKLKSSKKSFPLLIVLFAVIFNIMNGYINGYYLFVEKPSHETTIIFGAHFWVGLLIFTIGFIMHIHSDGIILNLRKSSKKEYSIPFGGMFKWVTNPNYLGEFIQWMGWAILCWSSAGVAFAFFTFCNLFPRAISNHKWYKTKFSEYPSNRKRFFPYLY